jgi:large subunit ribosomal protein L16
LKNKHGKFWIRLIPNLPLSKKASETRMGKGKSPIRKWVAIVRSGIILFEVSGLIYKNIIPLLKIAQKKLSIRTKIIIKN